VGTLYCDRRTQAEEDLASICQDGSRSTTTAVFTTVPSSWNPFYQPIPSTYPGSYQPIFRSGGLNVASIAITKEGQHALRAPELDYSQWKHTYQQQLGQPASEPHRSYIPQSQGRPFIQSERNRQDPSAYETTMSTPASGVKRAKRARPKENQKDTSDEDSDTLHSALGDNSFKRRRLYVVALHHHG
jgi:hypothetical protein